MRFIFLTVLAVLAASVMSAPIPSPVEAAGTNIARDASVDVQLGTDGRGSYNKRADVPGTDGRGGYNKVVDAASTDGRGGYNKF